MGDDPFRDRSDDHRAARVVLWKNVLAAADATDLIVASAGLTIGGIDAAMIAIPIATRGPVTTVRGRVVDAVTGQGLPGVCILVGSTSWPSTYTTDAQGFWSFDVPTDLPLTWGVSFVMQGYVTQTVRVVVRPGTIVVPDVRLRSPG